MTTRQYKAGDGIAAPVPGAGCHGSARGGGFADPCLMCVIEAIATPRPGAMPCGAGAPLGMSVLFPYSLLAPGFWLLASLGGLP